MGIIKRSDLKQNFLKNIIMKIDLVGVLPSEVFEVVESVKSYLTMVGFSRFQKGSRQTGEIKFDVKGTSIENEKITNSKSYDVYNFVDDNRGISIDIRYEFITISIKSTKYIEFSEYLNYLITIYDNFAKRINSIKISRLGLRKVNSCLVLDKSEVNELFKINYFNFSDIDGENTVLLGNQKYLFANNDKKINLITNVQEGLCDEKKIYQVILDIDIYAENICVGKESNLLRDEILNMNSIIFNVFIQALTDKFIDILKSDDECPINYLIGVESNE